jgi:spore coat protein U-like protein
MFARLRRSSGGERCKLAASTPARASTLRTAAAWACGIAAVLGPSLRAEAGTATTTFGVQAVINSECNVSANTLNFGVYDPTSASPLEAATTISVYCTLGSPYTVALNVGTGGGAFTGRTMTSSSNTLTYNLYLDAARTQVWGDGSGSTVTASGTGTGVLTATQLNVYGMIPIAQDKPVGTYSSTITVTVSY